MKKIVSLLLLTCLVALSLVACGPKEKEYTLAIGIDVAETLSSTKVTETVALVVTDADGKIAACRLGVVD